MGQMGQRKNDIEGKRKSINIRKFSVQSVQIIKFTRKNKGQNGTELKKAKK